MSTWINLPILSAIDYFQGVLGYFMSFAQKYSNIIGLLGLVWTALRLINSRIDMRGAWWDTFSKWIIFIILMNFYVTGTDFLRTISNSIGINAGNGKTTIINNFSSLKKRIDLEMKQYEKFKKGLLHDFTETTGVSLVYIQSEGTYDAYSTRLRDEINKIQWKSNEQKKKAQSFIDDYNDKVKKETINYAVWDNSVLEALNNILYIPISKDKAIDLTDVYIPSKPELAIWLLDNNGNNTGYFSAEALINIGLLAGNVIYEKSQIEIIENIDKLGNITYQTKRKTGNLLNFSMDYFINTILATILRICLIVSVIFATIQYIMCVLEFTIIQSIGAMFIPFYLFDGTKDIPKKLIPVFIGFAIKFLVMVICLMFVINSYLIYTDNVINSSSGDFNFTTFTEGVFMVLLSFILTSNAPKIAMTILTGQPQLSMGEFVQAAGALGVGAMVGKRAGEFATNPGKAFAKKKAHDWSERSAAYKEGKKQNLDTMKKVYAQNNGINDSSKSGKKQLNKDWNDFYKTNKKSIDPVLHSSGLKAKEKVKHMQSLEYQKNGGITGSIGRLASYVGHAALNPKETFLHGSQYNIPQNNTDVNRIVKDLHDEKDNNLGDNIDNSNCKPDSKKNDLINDPNIGTRKSV